MHASTMAVAFLADLRQYIYEQMGRIRANALVMDGLYGNDNDHGQDISKNNGHNGKAHPDEKIWRERPADHFRDELGGRLLACECGRVSPHEPRVAGS